jgi:hypothetical protein
MDLVSIPRVRRFVWGCATLVAMGLGCKSATASGPSNAAAVGAVVALASAVGAVNLATGHCFTPCVNGTTCNAKTGLCDRTGPSACGEFGCPKNKVCDESGMLPQCVQDTASNSGISERHYEPANVWLPPVWLGPLPTPGVP